MHKGRFIGVGVGPGDPELMTLKAVKAIEDADVLMLPSADKTSCRAYQTAYKACRGMDDKECMFEPFPMKMDKEELELFHKMIAGKVESVLDEGKDVVFLTIGDTCVYSTYDYVERLVGDDGYETLRISGVPSFVAAAGRLDMSLGDNGRPIHIIPGNGNIEEALKLEGTKIFMKTGRNLDNIKGLLAEYEKSGGRIRGVYKCSMPEEKTAYCVDDIGDDWGYMNILIAD